MTTNRFHEPIHFDQVAFKEKLSSISASSVTRNVRSIQMRRDQYVHNSRSDFQHASKKIQTVLNILTVFAISILINNQILPVTCAGSSAILGIDVDDPRKTNDDAPVPIDVSAGTGSSANTGIYLDKIGSLEMSIAAVFNKVAYGTTTKRSIPDNVFVPNLTTVPTPQLTTLRTRDKDDNRTRNEDESGKDHFFPTIAPNADILKNKNNGDRDRHRNVNSTPAPSGHEMLKKKHQATIPMYPVDIPAYTSPARNYFTRPLPPGSNPFADKPTLRGTNSDSGIINTSSFIGRRPAPPSLVPSHEKIPYRPPDLQNGSPVPNNKTPNDWSMTRVSDVNNQQGNSDYQRKKALNTPAQKTLFHKVNSMNENEKNSSEIPQNKNIFHFPSISRILSGSNGRKEDIPEVLLRTVTVRPSVIPNLAEPSISPSQSQANDFKIDANINGISAEDHDDEDDYEQNTNGKKLDDDRNLEEEEEEINNQEPKTQPKLKEDSSSASVDDDKRKYSTEPPLLQSDLVYSTQIIQNLAAKNNDKTNFKATANNKPNIHTSTSSQQPTAATWNVAWNIHVYLSAVLFTVLAVYSIFKMIFYDKLTHLVSQSYFICLHLFLITICLSRIFYLCYDAYNIDNSFNMFVSEILLNLPATLLTIAFAVLVLFLLLKSMNHKTNRYSALMRPLTVIVGSTVHIFLCVTLHYVESYGQKQRNQQILYQQSQRNGFGARNYPNLYNTPPRVLSLICQIIYIFVCFSLGFFYLHIYKVLKRILRNKSQNYIHGYQNLSYAIHITIATALLFILLGALQVYGAISISTTRPLISSLTEIDWLQWGYQFSLRLIEIAIIALLTWVTGLKTGPSKILQREKGMEQHNVSGFALFPCTSTSSQEHFEADYPAICNANTNLHTYTLRTGKPIYDDTFALNSLGMENNLHSVQHPRNSGVVPTLQAHHHRHNHHDGNQHMVAKNGREFQNDFSPRIGGIYDTNSGRSSVIAQHNSAAGVSSSSTITDDRNDYLTETGTLSDHYENPNFELKSTNDENGIGRHHRLANDDSQQPDNFNDPVKGIAPGYDFQKFERPSFMDRALIPTGNCSTEFRASKNLKSLIKSNSNEQQQSKQNNLGGSHPIYNHHPSQTPNQPNNYNSFDRRGIRKSGTLNNIGCNGNVYQAGSKNTTASTSNINAVAGRSTGVRSLKHHDFHPQNNNISTRNTTGRASHNVASFKKDRQNNHAAPQRSNTSHLLSSSTSNDVNEYDDTISYDSSDGGHAVFYQPDAAIFKSQKSGDHVQILHQGSNCSGSGESASSSSMLVAENGFVRFRPLDELNGTAVGKSDNLHSPVVHNSSLGNNKHKERSYTNS